jgi:hypothetical protein
MHPNDRQKSAATDSIHRMDVPQPCETEAKSLIAAKQDITTFPNWPQTRVLAKDYERGDWNGSYWEEMGVKTGFRIQAKIS